jgi:hypothetical protein
MLTGRLRQVGADDSSRAIWGNHGADQTDEIERSEPRLPSSDAIEAHRLCSNRSGLAPRRLDDVKGGEREPPSTLCSRESARECGAPGV